MSKYRPYVIQSLVNGQWHTRNRLNELNHSLIGGKITERQFLDAAHIIIQNWVINYSDNATMRVVREGEIKRKRTRPIYQSSNTDDWSNGND